MSYCIICDIPQFENIDFFRAYIPETRLDEIASKPLSRQLETLTAEAILRLKLSEKYNILPTKIEIKRDENGCPKSNLCEISIAHTDGSVAIAFSDFPIGVDIEKIRKIRALAGKKIFTDNELSIIGDAVEHKFWEIWTRKEAFAKSDGRGLSSDLKYSDTLTSPLSNKLYTEKFDEFIVSVYSSEVPTIERLSSTNIFIR